MKEYKTIIFDVDGTLLNTAEGIISSVDYTIKELGLNDISYEVKESFVGPPIQRSLQKTYGLSDEETAKAATIFRKRYSTIDLCKAELYEDAIDLLKHLKNSGYKIGVATYKREDYAMKILDEFGITTYCDEIVGSDFEGKLTKADIIDICIANLDTSKDEILMIGDTDNDKIGAQQAGVDFLAVTYGFGFKDNYNDGLFASSCKEIIDMLSR